ncbi:WD40/YVTN/BNR-like repeat-containing protein [Myxosarcina sp. GI1(2024)]
MVTTKQQSGETSKPSSGKTTILQAIAATAEGLWFYKDSQQHLELSGHQINALAYNNDGLWVVRDSKSVCCRTDNGKWTEVASVKDLQLNCILPLTEKVLVGTSEAHLAWITDSGIDFIDSFDHIEDRSKWYTPWGDPPAVRTLAMSSQNDLYVNVHVGGILRSTDWGKSWQPTINLEADVHQVITVDSHPNLVLAATGRGLAISRDKGNSWQFERDGLHSSYARAVAVCDNQILMSVSDGPRGCRAAIYRLPLAGSGRFEKCQQGLPQWFSGNINTKNLVALENTAAFGTNEGDIFVSENAGSTWKQLVTGLSSINCLGLYLKFGDRQ